MAIPSPTSISSLKSPRHLKMTPMIEATTVVAIGTSLPELASAIASARKGENEFVLGNIVGSNIFNMLAVVGIATAISPVTPESGGFSRYVLVRDLPLLTLLSLSITLFGANWRNMKSEGSIRRPAAVLWLLVFAAYSAIMLYHETHG